MLLAREEMTAVEAVERPCGMQAQEAKPPFIGLRARVAGVRREEGNQALQARRLVPATLMRATLHLLSARDYPLFRAALDPMLEQAVRIVGARAEGLDVDALLPVARSLLE